MLTMLWLIITVLRPETTTTRSHACGETPVPSTWRATMRSFVRVRCDRWPRGTAQSALSPSRDRADGDVCMASPIEGHAWSILIHTPAG
jgi:hypothetical protein